VHTLHYLPGGGGGGAGLQPAGHCPPAAYLGSTGPLLCQPHKIRETKILRADHLLRAGDVYLAAT